MLRPSAKPFPGTMFGYLPPLEKCLTPRVRVHPAHAEQEGVVRGGHGEMQQSEEKSNKPTVSFLVRAVRKTPGGGLISAVTW